MFKSIKRFWKYLGAKLNSMFNEAADPKIQLEQAITEAKEQHQRLTEQASNVIANQKLAQTRAETKSEELAKLDQTARQALLMADEATKKGDAAAATRYTAAAEAAANRLIAVESELESLKNLAEQAAVASQQAKDAVQQNSIQLQKKIAEKAKLLSQLDQAKMQEQMNSALTSLSSTVGQDVPSIDEVREKIEQRHAKAMGAAELAGSSVESAMLEVESEAMNVEAQARLSKLRSQMGIGGAEQAAPAPAVEAPAAAVEPEPTVATEQPPTAG